VASNKGWFLEDIITGGTTHPSRERMAIAKLCEEPYFVEVLICTVEVEMKDILQYFGTRAMPVNTLPSEYESNFPLAKVYTHTIAEATRAHNLLMVEVQALLNTRFGVTVEEE